MFTNKSKQVFLQTIQKELVGLEERVEKNMEKLVSQIEERAKFYSPYDTGATWDSAYSSVTVENGIIEGIVAFDGEKAVELRYQRTGEVPDSEYVITNHENINAKFNTTYNPNASSQWLLRAFKEFEGKIKEELVK